MCYLPHKVRCSDHTMFTVHYSMNAPLDTGIPILSPKVNTIHGPQIVLPSIAPQNHNHFQLFSRLASKILDNKQLVAGNEHVTRWLESLGEKKNARNPRPKRQSTTELLHRSPNPRHHVARPAGSGAVPPTAPT